jgi:hypothetical protein
MAAVTRLIAFPTYTQDNSNILFILVQKNVIGTLVMGLWKSSPRRGHFVPLRITSRSGVWRAVNALFGDGYLNIYAKFTQDDERPGCPADKISKQNTTTYDSLGLVED